MSMAISSQSPDAGSRGPQQRKEKQGWRVIDFSSENLGSIRRDPSTVSRDRSGIQASNSRGLTSHGRGATPERERSRRIGFYEAANLDGEGWRRSLLLVLCGYLCPAVVEA